MWNPMQKKVVMILLAFVFVMMITGAVSAASGSNIVNSSTDCNKITKNVTNLNGSNGVINYNNTVNFTITVRNDHRNSYTYRVNDTLPAGLEYVSYKSTQGTYNRTTGIWSVGTLDRRESAVLNIIARVTGSNVCITNTAVLQTREGHYGNYHWNTEARANVTFCVPSTADLGVSKTVNNTHPNYHDSIIWTITAKNNGPNNATGVKVTDLLPSGLELVSFNATQGTYNPTTGIWTIGNLNAWCQAILNITAKVNTTNTCITNYANITGCEYDPCPTNNNANATICIPKAADLQISKTVNNTHPNYHDSIIWTITTKNNGPNNATGVKVNDLLPAGLQFLSYTATPGTSYDPNTGIWTIGNLDAWCQAVLNITAKVNTTNTCITNYANITGCEYDPCPTNNNANATICIPKAADLQISKTVNNTHPNYHNSIIWTIKAKNNGPSNATGVKVTDLLPTGLQIISFNTTQGTYNPTTGIWTIGNLNAWCQAILNITAKVNTTNTCITNYANITGCEYDPCPTNNNANASICIPAKSSLYLKTIAPTKCLGLTDIAKITFKVGNRGPNHAENTVFTWTIPEGMEYVSATVDQGTVAYNPATRTITWNLGNVAVGDPYLWVTTRILKEGTFKIKPTLSTSTYDPDLRNNIEFANVCGEANNGGGSGGKGNTVNAATIPLHKTGLPIGFLIAAITLVFAGLVPKRK